MEHHLSPTPFFNLNYVGQQISGPLPKGILQFLSDPQFSQVDPHVMFSKRHYKTFHKGIDDAAVDPFCHFLKFGWRERRSTHPFFQPAEYERLNVAAADNVSEFNRCFMAACRDPAFSMMQPMFDPTHYLENLQHGESVTMPLWHFLTDGWRESVSPFPLFDASFYVTQTGDTRQCRNPYVEYLSDRSHRYAPSPLFDKTYYLASTSGAADFRGSLLEHFVRFGAPKQARTSKSLVTLRAHPSRYSGFECVASIQDASGRNIWLCSASQPEWLISELDNISEVEPALSRAVLKDAVLHPHTGPLNEDALNLIEIMVRIARCNCVLVSEVELDEWLVLRVASGPAGLLSNLRQWLVLLSPTRPILQYWHGGRGTGAGFDAAMPDDPVDQANIVAQALTTSLPDSVVVRADSFGVTLLRRCGEALLSAIPRVALLVDDDILGPSDRQWLSEFISTNYLSFDALLSRGEHLAHIVTGTLQGKAETPRIITL